MEIEVPRARPQRLPLSRLAALALASLMGAGCATVYSPKTSHSTKSSDAAVTATSLIFADRAATATTPGVYVYGRYSTDPKVSFGVPTLTTPSSPPCGGGAAATLVLLDRRPVVEHQELETDARRGTILLGFSRSEIDRRGLLQQATTLDLPLFRAGATTERCMRLPLVGEGQKVEWTREPSFSFGMGGTLFIPFRRMHGTAAAPLFILRFGPWIGPIRLRGELGAGGAAARADNPNLVGYAYTGGLLADALLFSSGRFGLGAALGYDVLGVSFGPNVTQFSHEGAGFQGAIHGPRGGLLFALLAEPPVGKAFRRRRDSESGTIEIFGAAEWSGGTSSPTPAIWFTLSADAGF